MSDTTVERLQAAGVLHEGVLVEERHSEVFESLTEFEVDVILSLKQRLDAAVQEYDVDPESFYSLVGF